MKTGIISAMKEEFDLLLAEVETPKTTKLAMREYTEGKLFGRDVVLVFSQWGKTASASTTANLINIFKAGEIIFTGVAGALRADTKIGDIIIAKKLYHHDVDASPFKPRFFVPLIGGHGIPTNKTIKDKLKKASEKFISEIGEHLSGEDINTFNLHDVKVHEANIATGDSFVKTDEVRCDIANSLPDMYAVEMEGAAVAQVAWEHGVPFAVIRTISDSANSDSHMDYPRFLNRVASLYSLEIIRNYLE